MTTSSVSSIQYTPNGSSTPVAWSFSGYSASSSTSATVSVTPPTSVAATAGIVTINLATISGNVPVSTPVTVT